MRIRKRFLGYINNLPLCCSSFHLRLFRFSFVWHNTAQLATAAIFGKEVKYFTVTFTFQIEGGESENTHIHIIFLTSRHGKRLGLEN